MAKADIGLIGLGTMGSALALNIAENEFGIAVFNRTIQVVRDFADEAGALADKVVGTESLEDFVTAIKTPRAIILMVPAGEAVDQQIAALAPLLDPDDLVIDAGNANFHDTNRRATSGLTMRFLGMGVSGGEEGARHGPSIMGGGAREDWDRVAPILTAIAAKAEDGSPCATWMGQAGAGHFVKAVHNGIEYADMQMIAEVYGLMRDGMAMDAAQIGAQFEDWNNGPLQSYLIEISGKVAQARDVHSDAAALDVILDRAGQKGTGRWTAIEAQHLAAPVPVIEAAVMARNVSARLDERKLAQAEFGAAPQSCSFPLETLEQAMIAGKILCYAQGFAMIEAASKSYGWALPLADIARVWRAGCIIRSAMLNDMARALDANPGTNLILAEPFSGYLKSALSGLRQVVSEAIAAGHPVTALAQGLIWFDMMRTERGTANMIQAQRDFFGEHGFERLDGGKDPHGPWAGHG